MKLKHPPSGISTLVPELMNEKGATGSSRLPWEQESSRRALSPPEARKALTANALFLETCSCDRFIPDNRASNGEKRSDNLGSKETKLHQHHLKITQLKSPLADSRKTDPEPLF